MLSTDTKAPPEEHLGVGIFRTWKLGVGNVRC